jgi:hypothetical protein
MQTYRQDNLILFGGLTKLPSMNERLHSTVLPMANSVGHHRRRAFAVSQLRVWSSNCMPLLQFNFSLRERCRDGFLTPAVSYSAQRPLPQPVIPQPAPKFERVADTGNAPDDDCGAEATLNSFSNF